MSKIKRFNREFHKLISEIEINQSRCPEIIFTRFLNGMMHEVESNNGNIEDFSYTMKDCEHVKETKSLRLNFSYIVEE